MKRKVFKFDVHRMYDIYPAGFGEFVLSVFPEREIPLGRVALSLRKGKRRVLVNGFVEAIPESDRDFGLRYYHCFKPCNPQKLQSIFEANKVTT